MGEQCVSRAAPASARPLVCAKALAFLPFGGESRCELKLIHVLWSAALTLNCLSDGEQVFRSDVQQLPVRPEVLKRWLWVEQKKLISDLS